MMTERERKALTIKHNLRATYYMPLIMFVAFMAWLRGWKVDPKRTEQNVLLIEEKFVKDGIQYYRHGGRTWIIGKVDRKTL
jgi:hypothetical protein